MPDGFLLESLIRFTGQTVTIFTTSGGLSGSGFTGVLASICNGTIKLITDIGAPPSCPVGSACDDGFDGCCDDGFGYGYGYRGRRGWNWNYGWRGGRDGCGYGCGRWGWGGYNWLGSVTEIPIERIASFTHNAI